MDFLWKAPVDFDDAGQARAYFATARPVIEALIATPARDVAGFRIKAEAVAWCCGGGADFGLGETPSARLIASLLADLIRIGAG